MANQAVEQVSRAMQSPLDPTTCMKPMKIWYDVTVHEVDEAMERRMLAMAR